MSASIEILMIQGSQKSILFQFPNSINVSDYNFIFQAKSKLSGVQAFSFSSIENKLIKSGQNVLLFIPASATRELSGEFEAQIGFFIEPDDLTILPKFDLIIESAIISQEEAPNGDSVFDEIAAQNIIINVDAPTPLTFSIQGVGIVFGQLTLPNTQTASYTFQTSDSGKIIVVDSASQTTLTISDEVNFEIGSKIIVMQKGLGQVNFSASVSITILNKTGTEKATSSQNAIATLLKISETNWILFGDLLSV